MKITFTIFLLLHVSNLISQEQAFVRTCSNGINVNYEGLSSSHTNAANINVTGELVRVPLTTFGLHSACDTISEDYTGKIALIDRGHCGFIIKLRNVQNQGAIGAIICNFDSVTMNMAVEDPSIVIPAIALPVQHCSSILADMTNEIVEANFSFINDIQVCPPSAGAIGITSESGSIYVKNKDGIILRGKDDNCYLLSIDDNGEFVKTMVACPLD